MHKSNGGGGAEGGTGRLEVFEVLRAQKKERGVEGEGVDFIRASWFKGTLLSHGCTNEANPASPAFVLREGRAVQGLPAKLLAHICKRGKTGGSRG